MKNKIVDVCVITLLISQSVFCQTRREKNKSLIDTIYKPIYEESTKLEEQDLPINMDERFLSQKKTISREEDLDILNSLKNVYFWNTTNIEQGNTFNDSRLFFTAESLTNLLPTLKRTVVNYIPSIFCYPSKVIFNKKNELLEITLNKQHELIESDHIIIIDTNNNSHEVRVELINNENTFSIKDVLPKGCNYFLYGKKTNDVIQINRNELILLELKINQLLLNKIEENELTNYIKTCLLEEKLCEAEKKTEDLTRKIEKINTKINRK